MNTLQLFLLILAILGFLVLLVFILYKTGYVRFTWKNRLPWYYPLYLGPGGEFGSFGQFGQ